MLEKHIPWESLKKTLCHLGLASYERSGVSITKQTETKAGPHQSQHHRMALGPQNCPANSGRTGHCWWLTQTDTPTVNIIFSQIYSIKTNTNKIRPQNVRLRCKKLPQTTWVKEGESRSVISDSLQPHGLYSPWNFPGQNTEVGSRPLLQGIFSTQGSNPGFPHCKQILYQLSHKGRILDVKIGPRHTTLYTDKNFHLKTSHQNTAQ